jgi:hypothetical protein
MALARLEFLTMFLTAKSSTQITWFSYAILRDSLCRKSSRTLAILLDVFATKHLAFRRLLKAKNSQPGIILNKTVLENSSSQLPVIQPRRCVFDSNENRYSYWR